MIITMCMDYSIKKRKYGSIRQTKVKIGAPMFTTRTHITNIEAENDTTLSLSLNEYFYMEPTLHVDGDILMGNDIHYLKISGNKEAIVVDLKGGSKIGVRWPYLEGTPLNEDYFRDLEEHLIPILKDFPLLIGNYRLTLRSGNMKIEQIYQ